MTSISGRLFYIPTNRACETALSSYLLEAGHLAISQETPVTFALIEAIEGPHVSVHKEIISRAADETDLRIIHLTTEAQSIFIPRLVAAAGFIEGEAAKLKTMLLSQDVCY